MAGRRRISRRLPLEWVYKHLAMATKDTTYTESLDLDLLQEELAEIWRIDARTALVNAAVAAVDDLALIDACLSMNPDADRDPSAPANLQALEIFYSFSSSVVTVLDGTAASAQRHSADWKNVWAAPEGKPILVGTNVGMVARWSSSADMYTAGSFGARLYFTRRRATAPELNQILLKRR